MRMQTMNLRDEETERQFLEGLAQSGVPISIKTRLMNIPIEFEEEIERKQDEQVLLAVAEQETRKRQYQALRDANLPIPQDLRNDFEPQAVQNQTPDTEEMRTPVFGTDPTGVYPNIAPTPDDMGLPAGQGTDEMNAPTAPAAMVIPMQPPEGSGRLPSEADLWRRAQRMRAMGKEHGVREELGGDSFMRAPAHVGMRRYVEVEKPEEDEPVA
jgi:hypothetical protein